MIKLNTLIERYAVSLIRTISLLKELLILNQNIPDIINSNDIEELNTLLDKKQGIISEIDKINEEVIANNYSQLVKSPKIDRLKNDRLKLLEEIHEIEKKNIQLANAKHKEYEQMIKKTNKQQQIKSYTTGGEQSYFFDKKK